MKSPMFRIIFVLLVSLASLAACTEVQANESRYRSIIERLRSDLERDGRPVGLRSAKPVALPAAGDDQAVAALSPARHVGRGSTDCGPRPMALRCSFDGQSFLGHFALLRHLQRTNTGERRKATIDLAVAVVDGDEGVVGKKTPARVVEKNVKQAVEKVVKKVENATPLTEAERAAARLLEETSNAATETEEEDLPIQ